MSPSSNAPSEGLTCNVEIVTPLIPAKSVTSESITAPAAVTFVASVTSAPDSIPDNLTALSLIVAPIEAEVKNAPSAATYSALKAVAVDELKLLLAEVANPLIASL